MRRQTRWADLVCWLALGCAALSCSGPSRELRPRPSLLESSRPLEQLSSPPEWRYHPRRPAQLKRGYELPGGERLFVGAAGERWLVRRNGAAAEPATSLAPEALVGILSAQREPWIFVGESGATYHAATPLGPFVASRAPPERLARVSSGERSLLGVSEEGRLLLSPDAGASWQGVGPSHERFSDVALWPPYALALAAPERLWWSKDEGHSWVPLDARPFGAERFDRDEEAGAVLRAALGPRRLAFSAGAPPQLQPLGRNVRADEPQLDVAPLEGANARAIAAGRAFLNDGAYFEVELGVRAGTLSGKLGEPLVRRKAPLLSSCVDVAVAGFERWVYVACTRERNGTARSYEIFRSSDGGESFEREPYTARGNPEVLRMAAGADGALLITGVCPPQDELAGCHARGIQQRSERPADAGVTSGLEPVAAPALDDNALALTFAADGRSAYAVGQRTKSDALFLFAASDLSRGFVAREISRLDATGSSQRQVKSFTAARDGQLSLITSYGSGAEQLVLLDASGRTASIHTPPIEQAALGAYGAWALAVGPEEVWESLDGGAHWEPIGRLPRALCPPGRSRCTPPVFCRYEGCVLGDSLSRRGWRAEPATSAAVLPPTPPRERATRASLRKPFACELTDAEWTELAGVDRLPDSSQAALGKAAWFALSADDALAAAGLWIAVVDRARPESAPRVRHSDLLRPSERPAESAYYATLQVEGAAALRYSVPGSGGAAGAHLTQVEIAWENLFEGRQGRAVIADAGPLQPGDFVKSTGPARRAQVDLLSISGGGIFARVHRQPEHDQVTYFLDGSSVRQLPPLTGDLVHARGVHREMVRLGADSVALLNVSHGSTYVRAKRQRDGWQLDAMTVGFYEAERFALRQSQMLTYADGRPALHVTTRFASGSSEARLLPLQAEGDVFGASAAVPTQTHLPEGSFGCSAQQRRGPRLLSPPLPGTRHPVVVQDPVEPQRVFLTDGAVVHGTVDEACVHAFDAEPVRTPLSVPGARERALLSAEGPSWLFRMSGDNPRREARVEYRTMKCRFDEGIEIPPEVYELSETRVEG